MTPPVVAYIALGANLGDARETVRLAMAGLDRLPETRLLRTSSLYLTAPVGLLDQPDFINAVAAVETTLPAADLLQALLEAEHQQGRVRSIANAPRTLDLDILLYCDLVLDTPALTLPHPRLHLRAFVLEPLAEIAPDLTLPGRGSVAAWLPAVHNQKIQRLPC